MRKTYNDLLHGKHWMEFTIIGVLAPSSFCCKCTMVLPPTQSSAVYSRNGRRSWCPLCVYSLEDSLQITWKTASTVRYMPSYFECPFLYLSSLITTLLYALLTQSNILRVTGLPVASTSRVKFEVVWFPWYTQNLSKCPRTQWTGALTAVWHSSYRELTGGIDYQHNLNWSRFAILYHLMAIFACDLP
jgi:hypothetical protein